MRFRTVVMLLAPVLLFAACEEDSPLGEGDGAVAIVSDRATTSQTVGNQFTLAAFAIDANRTRLPEAIAAAPSGAVLRIDSTVFHPEISETRFFITPTALDLNAFVVLTGAGLTDTVFVDALPAAIVATAPDSVGSGQTATITVTGRSATGASIGPVPFTATSSSTTIAGVSGATISGRTAGTTTVIVVGPGGVIADTISIRVFPGPFAGTVGTATQTTSGAYTITFTGTATQPIDSNTEVVLNTGGADLGFRIARDTVNNTITAVIPFGVAAGTYPFTLNNVGSANLSLAGTYTTPATGSEDLAEPNNTPLTSSALLVPGELFIGQINEANPDDFYTLTVPTGSRYEVTLNWSDTADLDVYVTNAAGTLNVCADDALNCAAATGAKPQAGTTSTLAPGVYRVYVNAFEASGANSTYTLLVRAVP